MLRLLIIIFALNSFAPPASGLIACDMMDSGDMVSMNQNMDNMSGTVMNCSMHDGNSCNSTQCMTNCAANFPPLVIDSVKVFNIDSSDIYPQSISQFLYRIFLPVNTPPPLV
jgi:predicted lipoprotein with Yx(FWY)xxD motif